MSISSKIKKYINSKIINKESYIDFLNEVQEKGFNEEKINAEIFNFPNITIDKNHDTELIKWCKYKHII